MSHVFISYVREDALLVDRLVKHLESNGIKVWLDRNSIAPGQIWSAAIRNAIKSGSFFLACFSQNSIVRLRTYMNEELTLAIEELRLRPADRAWFIPVLLSQCRVPDREIGAGQTLHSIQHVCLYEDWEAGLARIVSAIRSIPNLINVDEVAQSLFEAGLTLAKARDHKAAIGEYTKSIALKPDFAEAYFRRGISYMSTHHWKKSQPAVDDFSKALEAKPNFALVYQYRAQLLCLLKGYRECIADHDAYVRLQPNDPQAYIWRAAERICHRDFTEAIKDGDAALRLDSNNAQAYVIRAWAYTEKGHYRTAIQECNKAIEINPREAAAYNVRFESRKKIGDIPDCIEDKTEAERLGPISRPLKFHLDLCDLSASVRDEC